MIWTTIQDHTKKVGIALALIAVGAIGQSIVDKSAKLPWLHQQAAVAYHLQTVEIPKIKSIAGCETVRANIATTLATKSENGADINLSAVPNCPSLPPKAVPKR